MHRVGVAAAAAPICKKGNGNHFTRISFFFVNAELLGGRCLEKMDGAQDRVGVNFDNVVPAKGSLRQTCL